MGHHWPLAWHINPFMSSEMKSHTPVVVLCGSPIKLLRVCLAYVAGDAFQLACDV